MPIINLKNQIQPDAKIIHTIKSSFSEKGEGKKHQGKLH